MTMTEKIADFFKPGTVQLHALIIVAGIVGYLIAKRIVRAAIGALSRKRDQKALHWGFIARTIDAVLLFAAVFAVMSQLPVLDSFVSTLVAGSAVFVAAVGLASQESMANIVSGMFLSMFKPFAAGDRVRLLSADLIGWIEDMGLRHTIIRTVENNRIIVPNTVMNKEIVENSDFGDERIVNFLDVKITYESDIRRAMDIVLEEVLAHPGVADWRNEDQKRDGTSKADVLIRDIANNCVELRVGVWTSNINDSFTVSSDLRFSIMERFKTEGITIYYQTIRVDRAGR